MELHHLRYFLLLSEQEHISHTAELLNISQPALSRSIAALEKELGAPLFDRYSNRIVLNRNGEEFAVYVKQILSLLGEGVDKIKREKYSTKGNLRIIFHVFADNLYPAIQEYTEMNPDISLQLFQGAGAEDNIYDNCDFFLAAETEAKLLSQTENQRPLWISEKLFEEEMVIMVSPNYPGDIPHEGDGLMLKDLQNEKFIVNSVSRMFFSDPIYQYCSIAGFQPNIACIVDDFTLCFRYVDAGRGIVAIPEGCYNLAKRIAPELKKYKIKDINTRRSIYLLRKPDLKQSEIAMDFWEFLKDYYQLA